MLGLGNKHSTRGFRYVPRFYDENMEDLKRRVAKARQEMGIPASTPKAGTEIKGAFSDAARRNSRSWQQQAKNIRLVIVIICLLYLAYVIMTTDYFTQLLTQMNAVFNAG